MRLAADKLAANVDLMPCPRGTEVALVQSLAYNSLGCSELSRGTAEWCSPPATLTGDLKEGKAVIKELA